MTRPKTGGRCIGTPNKLTFQTRQILVNTLASEYEKLSELLQGLQPLERLDAIIKLSKFVLPQMMPVNSTIAEKRGLVDSEQALNTINKNNSFTDDLNSIL